MRTLTTQESATLQAPAGYAAHARVRVKDSGGTWQDLTNLYGYDFLESVEWNESVDQPVAEARVTVRREVRSLSLAPLVRKSRINQVAGSYSPLLQSRREMVIEVATVPLDTPPQTGDWREVFRGDILGVDPGPELLEFTARDLGRRLQRAFIETERKYGSTSGVAVETVMQAILDDNATGVTLWVPVSPAWNVLPYVQKKEPVLEALRTHVLQFGWDVRYRWDSNTGAFRLALLEPPRTKTTPDWTLPPSSYRDVPTFASDDEDVRNRISIPYSDAADLDAAGQKKRKEVIVEDAASQASYGVCYMQTAEAATSNVDTLAEATRMGQAMLSDLKDPLAQAEVESWPLVHLELGDLVRLSANGVHSDQDEDLAVVALSHSFTRDAATTRLTLRGKPAGAHDAWLEMDARPGGAPSAPFTGPEAPTGLSAAAVAGGLRLTFAPPTTGPAAASYELHLSTTSGFPPSSSTLRATSDSTRFEVSDLGPGATYYARVVPRDAAGNRGTASAEVSVVAGRYPLNQGTGNLPADTKQDNGTVTPYVFARGHYSGFAADGDTIQLPFTYGNPPLVLLRGGLVSQPDSTKWSGGTYSSSAAVYEDLTAEDVTPSNFRVRGKLRQKATQTPQAVNADVANNALTAVGQTATVTIASAPSGAVGNSWVLHFKVSVTAVASGGTIDVPVTTTVDVVLALDSIDTGFSWVERGAWTYSVAKVHTGGGTSQVKDWPHEQKTLVVSGLTSAPPADQFRLRVKSLTVTTDGTGSGSVSAHLFSTAASPVDPAAALTFNTASDAYASKTPDNAKDIYWEVFEVT